MSRAAEARPVASRSDSGPGPWIVCGLFALLVAVVLSLVFWHLYDEDHDYRTAPMCNTLPASAGQGHCRYGLPATVTQVHVGSGKGATYWMTIQGNGPANGEVHFPEKADVLDRVAIGDTVHVEVWQGRVVRVDVFGVSDETSAAPRYGGLRALYWLIFAAITALWLLSAGLGRRYQVQSLGWFRVVADGVLVAATVLAFLGALFSLGDPDFAWLGYAIGAVVVIPSTWVTWRKQYPRSARALMAASKRRGATTIRARPVRRRRAWVTVCVLLLGLLTATAATGALLGCLHDVNVVRTYRASPACTIGAVGDCRQTVTATVYQVRVVDGGGSSNWLDLEGTGPADGLVLFSGASDFLRTIHEGDQVRVEIWRGQATAVTAHGQFVGTSAAPTEDRDNAIGILCLALLAALLVLRWCARRRRPWLPWRATGFPVVEVAVVTLAVTGCVLLGYDLVWGAVPVGLALAVLLYGVAVPTLVPLRSPEPAD